MIKRIVKLTVLPEEIENFKDFFINTKATILSFGCRHVECLQSTIAPQIFFTYSHWDSEEALDNYRQSKAFAMIWKHTKSVLAERAEAWSTIDVNA